jgi:hypothetical protein
VIARRFYGRACDAALASRRFVVSSARRSLPLACTADALGSTRRRNSEPALVRTAVPPGVAPCLQEADACGALPCGSTAAEGSVGQRLRLEGCAG